MISDNGVSLLATDNNIRSGCGVNCGAAGVNKSVEIVWYVDHEGCVLHYVFYLYK